MIQNMGPNKNTYVTFDAKTHDPDFMPPSVMDVVHDGNQGLARRITDPADKGLKKLPRGRPKGSKNKPRNTSAKKASAKPTSPTVTKTAKSTKAVVKSLGAATKSIKDAAKTAKALMKKKCAGRCQAVAQVENRQRK